MIHHISLAAKNPRHVALVLAEILGGQSVPAPPNFPADSWFILSGDEHGTLLEVLPDGTELQPDEPEAGFHPASTPPATYVASHAYISVDKSPEELLRIGAREGWLTRRCNRGPFELIECWIENRQMIEFASPEMKAQYLGFLRNPEAIQAALAQIGQE